MIKTKIKSKIKRALLNFEDDEREIEARKQKTKAALERLKKVARVGKTTSLAIDN